jgi:ABC-type antimicrobial peptide transport system permease subunit
LTSVDRNLSLTFHPLQEQLSAARQRERLVAWLSGFFGALALLLAAIGLHGVMSYALERRPVEIGIRMALGAQSEDVITLTIRHTLIMTVCGIAAGLLVATAVTRYLHTLLFGFEPLDPLTFVAPAALVANALLACHLPARRATSIDPIVALRCE